MADDKKVKIAFETSADLTSADDVKQALTDVEDRLRKIENEGKGEGLEKRIKKMRQLAAETENFADAYKTFDKGSPAAKDFKLRIDELNEAMGKLEQETSNTGESVEKYVVQADKAAKAMKEDAEAAQQMAKDLKGINFAQHIQLAGQFATGLRSLASISKDNGQDELAKDLASAAKGMDVVSGAAAGGLNLSKIIEGAGGARGALGKVTAFLTGPMGIALAASAAAWGLFQLAVKKSNDELDAILEKNAKSVGVVQTVAEIEKAARESILGAIQDQQLAVEGLIKAQREELQLAQEKRRLEVARTNAAKAVDLAQVDADRNSGEISELEAIKRRAEIEGQALAKIHAAKKEEREAELIAQNKRLEGEREELKLIRLKLVAAREAAETPRRLFTDEDKKRLKELSDLREKTRADIAAGKAAGVPTGIGRNTIEKSSSESNEILARAQKRAQEELRAGESLEVAAKSAEKLAGEYQRAAERFQKTIDEFNATTRKLGVDQEEADIKFQGTSKATDIRTNSRLRDAEERERQEAERKAQEAKESATNNNGTSSDLVADLDAAKKENDASAKNLNDIADRGIDSTENINAAASKMGDVVSAVEASGTKQIEAGRRLQSAVVKNSQSQSALTVAMAKQLESATRRLTTLEETVRSLS